MLEQRDRLPPSAATPATFSAWSADIVILIAISAYTVFMLRSVKGNTGCRAICGVHAYNGPRSFAVGNRVD